MPYTDRDAVARRVAEQMFANDRASAALGMQLHEATLGFARVSMLVREDMLNGHGKCHGGVVFALADTAFAFACNSHNDVHVALQCSISFSRASVAGDLLTATAQERMRTRKTGVYDITITGPDGEERALFRGVSYGVGTKNLEIP